MTTTSPLSSPPAGTGPAPGRAPGRLPVTAGRSVALVIGVPVVLGIMAASAFSLVQDVGKASFPVGYTVPLQDGRLAVSTGGGDATVHGVASPAGSARVSGIVRYDLARPAVRSGPGTISLACPGIDMGNCSLSGTIDAPAGAALTVNTGGGDLSASGLSGHDTLGSDGGTLTVSGDVSDLTATSGGGNMAVSQVSGTHVALSSDGGDVRGSTVTSGAVTVDSGGGDVTLTFTTPPHNLQVNSDGGDIAIVVPPGSDYHVVTSTDGGTLTSAIAADTHAPDVLTLSSGGGDISVSYPS